MRLGTGGDVAPAVLGEEGKGKNWAQIVLTEDCIDNM